MASIGIIETTVSSVVSNATDSFVEVVESSNLTDGKIYYVICHALVEGGLTNETDSFRLVDRTNSDTVLSNSTMIREPYTANYTQSYYYLGRFTAGSGGGGLAFEQKSSVDGFTVSTQYLSMLLLDLSELSAEDYFYANNTTSTVLTDDYVTFATATPSTIKDDDWLVLGWQATDTNVVNAYSTNVQLYSDIDHDDINSVTEGEDLTEVLNVLQGKPYTIPSTISSVWSIKSKITPSGGSATNNTHLESTLVGLRLNAFSEYAKVFTSAETTTTSTAFNEYATVTFNPVVDGDVAVFGSSLFHAGGTGRPASSRVQVQGTTLPNTQPNTEYSCKSNDGSDVLPMSYVFKYASDGSSKAIDLDCLKTTPADIGFSKVALVAFTAEIADRSDVFSAVAVSTFASGSIASSPYTSGSVSSSTYNSGSVASEVNPE